MAKILYHAVPGDWRKEEKYQFLEKSGSVAGVKWTKLAPDKKGNWITNDTDEEFDTFIPIGSKAAKAKGGTDLAIFKTYSLGVSTNRDAVVYDFDAKRLAKRVEQFAEDYNAELHRWQKKGRPKDVDNFVSYEKVKWSRNLKRWFRQEDELKFKASDVRESAYRPFTRLKLHYARMFVDEFGTTQESFPTQKSEKENRMVLCPSGGGRSPFWSFSTNQIPNLNFVSIDSAQCLPLYIYSEDGKERRDNITSKALTLFQIFYEDDAIKREDIFNYVYALLHHPTYRTRYAENLKRELPRIPFIGVAAGVPPAVEGGILPPGKGVKNLKRSNVSDAIPPGWKPGSTADGTSAATFFPLSAIEKMQGDAKPDHDPKASAKLFHTFAAAGKKLAELHVNYESAKEFPLKRIENKEVPLDWRVESMKLLGVGRASPRAVSDAAKAKGGSSVASPHQISIRYNDFLTLTGIPPEVFDYRLGNRSALEWVIDQYRVTRDEHAQITSDPNRLDDEEYIVRLIGQVITVSLETQKVVQGLPQLGLNT